MCVLGLEDSTAFITSYVKEKFSSIMYNMLEINKTHKATQSNLQVHNEHKSTQ